MEVADDGGDLLSTTPSYAYAFSVRIAIFAQTPEVVERGALVTDFAFTRALLMENLP